MKKYLSLFAVFLLVGFITFSNVARAENGGIMPPPPRPLPPTGSGSDKPLPPPLPPKENNDGEKPLPPPGDMPPQNLGGNPNGEDQNSGDAKNQMDIKRAQAKQKLEDLKIKAGVEKDPATAKLKENRIAGREQALQRFDAAVLRISNLKGRVDSQIAKLKAKGVDTTNAETSSTTAQTNLDNAKSKITDANVLLSTSINNLSTADKAKLKTLSGDIQKLLNDARGSLNDAVKSLKDGLKAKMGAMPNGDNQNAGENNTQTPPSNTNN